MNGTCPSLRVKLKGMLYWALLGVFAGMVSLPIQGVFEYLSFGSEFVDSELIRQVAIVAALGGLAGMTLGAILEGGRIGSLGWLFLVPTVIGALCGVCLSTPKNDKVIEGAVAGAVAGFILMVAFGLWNGRSPEAPL